LLWQSKNTYAAKPDCASKTLVLLGIVVLEGNLKFNRFCELPLWGPIFLLCACHHGGNGLLKTVSGDLARNETIVYKSCKNSYSRLLHYIKICLFFLKQNKKGIGTLD